MKNILIIFVLLSLFTVSCKKEKIIGEVTYSVTCDKPGFHVKYETTDETVINIDVEEDAWEHSFEVFPDQFLFLEAQSLNSNSSITVRIDYDGELLNTITSIGNNPTATVHDNVPF